MKRKDFFIKRRSPNVVSVGDTGLDSDGRRFVILAVWPNHVAAKVVGVSQYYSLTYVSQYYSLTYERAGQLLSA